MKLNNVSHWLAPMDESKKSRGSKSSALPVLDPVSEPVSPCVTPTENQDSNPVGRPTDYDPSFCGLAASLCAQGATDEEVAESIGVSVRTIYNWKAKYPEFVQALQLGKDACDDRVERSLYNRAVGYTFDSLKIMQYEGVPVVVPFKEHVPPDVGAAKLWLTNRRADQWREKVEQTIKADEAFIGLWQKLSRG